MSEAGTSTWVWAIKVAKRSTKRSKGSKTSLLSNCANSTIWRSVRPFFLPTAEPMSIQYGQPTKVEVRNEANDLRRGGNVLNEACPSSIMIEPNNAHG